MNQHLAAAIASGNVSAAPMEEEEEEDISMSFAGFSASTREAQEKHAQRLKAFEAKQRQRFVSVPTDDGEVKAMLRAYSQPICLFGERALDRRERLKRIIAEVQVDLEASGVSIPVGTVPPTAEKSTSAAASAQYSRNKKAFFTPASNELIVARQEIARESWQRAQARLAKEAATEVVEDEGENSPASIVTWKQIATLNEPRPISTCSFSRDATELVTASFDHNVRIYDVKSFTLKHTLHGHENRVCDAKFSSESAVVCSGSAEGQVRVWNCTTSNSSVLTGHVSRVGRLAPFGNFLISTSFDRTFRMWDLRTEQCILLQDGHSREVYACAVHPDHSLLCTTDLGGIVRVWDLRCANTTHTFTGHTLGVLDCDFASNGTLLSTASLDNSVRLWDLRKSTCISVLPCHLQAVTGCRFSANSKQLATSSHDRTACLWDVTSGRKLAQTAKLHEGPILGMAFASGLVCTVGHDRSIKFVEE